MFVLAKSGLGGNQSLLLSAYNFSAVMNCLLLLMHAIPWAFCLAAESAG
jgi:hypothetical protein